MLGRRAYSSGSARVATGNMHFDVIRIQDADDPAVAAYRDVRERDLTGRQGLFVAEGAVVLRQITAPTSLCRLRSLLIAEHRLESMADVLAAAPRDAVVHAAPQSVLDAIAGFHLHRGLLGLGEKPAPRGLEEVLEGLGPDAVVLAAAGVGNHDNIGGLFRNAAAFGAGAVVLDDRCADPFYRKAIRVSVGAVLRTPSPLPCPLDMMVNALNQAGFEIIALTPGASESLASLRPGGRRALLVGSEGPGLPKAVIDRWRAVAIPMSGGFDSLNVATAAAIALHQMTRI